MVLPSLISPLIENQNKMKEIDSKGGCVWSDLEKERLLFAKHVYGSDTTKFTVWEKGEGESFAVTTGEGCDLWKYDMIISFMNYYKPTRWIHGLPDLPFLARSQ